VTAAATAEDGQAFARHLEDDGVFVRLDPAVEPRLFRGATISRGEVDALRSIERVVRGARVRHLGTGAVVTDQGDRAVDGRRVFVDCTARGVPDPTLRPVFEPDRITLQYVTVGFAPWSAATVAVVEARHDDDEQRNRLCPPAAFSGDIAGVFDLCHPSMQGLVARAADPAVSEWTDASRLNPSKGATDHLDDPRVPAAFEAIVGNIGAALTNLARRTGNGVGGTSPSS
jgi:hypothetical protein